MSSAASRLAAGSNSPWEKTYQRERAHLRWRWSDARNVKRDIVAGLRAVFRQYDIHFVYRNRLLSM